MKSHFNFNKQERSGIFFLLLLIIVLQLGYFALSYFPFNSNDPLFELDVENQKIFDSLVVASRQEKDISIKQFNPNYLSDFKGYTLGLSPMEMDRLKQFRVQNKFVNSAEEFQKVTEVSDSLLDEISPFFKFPDWVKNKRKNTKNAVTANRVQSTVRDLNVATADDLRKINGIGEKLSARILKFRERLGGFLVDEQLYDVYGLSPEVAERALLKFKVLDPPEVKKININLASANQIATLIYLKYNVAENIVSYREENGPYTSLKDLSNVYGFPINKIDRIGLYLSY